MFTRRTSYKHEKSIITRKAFIHKISYELSLNKCTSCLQESSHIKIMLYKNFLIIKFWNDAIAFKKVLVHKILLLSLLLTNFIPISLQELSHKHLYYYLQDHSCISFVVCHIFLISISNRNNMRNSPFPEPCDIW